MIEVSLHTTVPFPPEAVHAVISDPTEDPRWRDHVRSSALVQGRAGEVGAVYAQDTFEGGSAKSTTLTIEQVEPDRAFTTRTTGGHATVVQRFQLTETGDETAIELTLNVDLPTMLGPMVRREVRKQVQDQLAKRLPRLLDHRAMGAATTKERA